MAFKRAGYSLVCEAERGDEGLRLVRERQPSLVLLDVMMPGLDGFEVLKRLRDGKDTASTFVGTDPLLRGDGPCVRGV